MWSVPYSACVQSGSIEKKEEEVGARGGGRRSQGQPHQGSDTGVCRDDV